MFVKKSKSNDFRWPICKANPVIPRNIIQILHQAAAWYNADMENQMQNVLLSTEERRVLQILKSALEEMLGERLLKLVLYGSKARGDYDSESDIDIAIIVKNLTRELKHQLLDKIAEIEIDNIMPLSTLILSEKDFKFLKKRERRIAFDIEREDIPL